MSNQASGTNQAHPHAPGPIDTRPHAGEMMSWNDVDFDLYTGPVLEQFADAVTPPNPRHNYLESLPVELLLGIYNMMTTVDKLRAAYSYPHLFLSKEKINVFTVDAHEQLGGIHPNRRVPVEEEEARAPLLLKAITCGFSLDVIRNILDHYEEVSKARGVDFNILLNNEFPDRDLGEARSDPRGPYRREMWSPLHGAVSVGNIDIVEHLLSRGADIHRLATVEIGHEMQFLKKEFKLTPFHLALDIAANSKHYFATQDKERDDRILRIARRLGTLQKNDKPLTAFSADFQEASPDILALIGADVTKPYIESENAIAQMLQDSEQVPGVNRATLAYQDAMNTILAHALRASRPLRLVITWLLGNGAVVPPRYAEDSMFNLAFTEARCGTNVAWVYFFEIGQNLLNVEGSTYRAMTVVPHEVSLPFIEIIADMMKRSNYVFGQRLLIWAAMDLSFNSAMRRWIVSHVDVHYTPLLLRRAIAYADRQIVSALLDDMEAMGRDIDEGLSRADYPEGENLETRGIYGSALNVAISECSWADAADLLRRGANPSRVRPNLRHRIRRLRDRMHENVELGMMTADTQLRLPVNPGLTQEQVLDSVYYVFQRMLDDPNHPLPEYSRLQRGVCFSEDDEVNDSDLEDEPLRTVFKRELKDKREAGCRDSSVDDIYSKEAYGYY